MRAQALDIEAGSRTLVRGLNWNMQPGECWCILGRNGAGKSSLLRTLAGLRAPATGEVRLNGRAQNGWALHERARLCSYLPQSRRDAFSYTALETVLSARHPYQEGQYWESAHDLEVAVQALRSLDVAHLAERDVRTLSGGERQRVAIAATLAQQARYLLLDEPASALDLAHQVGVMQLLAGLCKSGAHGVLFVSHDLNLAYRAATHALLLAGNGQWQAGPIAQLFVPETLSDCLGYPIVQATHQGQNYFLPEPLSHG